MHNGERHALVRWKGQATSDVRMLKDGYKGGKGRIWVCQEHLYDSRRSRLSKGV